ncbi:MAG: methyltransferase domain-containing protein [Alphaproteobacteria bacterium]|nr:methyltransferase domain-containing protein [Alphaproteobacteria bacterium]
MRKDHMAVRSGEARDETRFIADHWAAIWREEGGPAKAIADVTRAEEYRAIAPVLDALPAGARVLDGGCGLGAWTQHMRTRGFDAVGLDIAEETVAQLNGLFGGGSFRVADIRATGLPGASFDFYFSWGVFEHFEDGQQGCLREAYRLLKPGARLAISVPFDNLRHALAGAGAVITEPPGAPMRFYQWRLTRRELARELAIAGFAVERIVPIGKISGLQRALGRAGRFAPPLARVLAPLVPARAVAHMLLAVARKPDGG